MIRPPWYLSRPGSHSATSSKKSARSRNVKLVLNGCSGRQAVPGDADQLRQVMTNLIENAIKYGRDGGQVTLSLTRKDHLPSLRGPGVVLDEVDQGEGISYRHVGRLTERFYRVDPSHTSPGTGLGLAIVKEVVDAHGGSLHLESQPEQGSLFIVTLPIANQKGE